MWVGTSIDIPRSTLPCEIPIIYTMAPHPIAIIGTDAANCFEDLSDLIPKAIGTFSFSENPYDVLIDACGSDPVCCPSRVL